MAGMQSYGRKLLVLSISRAFNANVKLREPNQRRYHLFYQAYSIHNRLVFQKSTLLSYTGRLVACRLESTSTIQSKNLDSVVLKTQTPEIISETPQLSDKANTAVSSDVVFDESTLPPGPSSFLTEVPDVEFIYTDLKERSFESLGLGSWWPWGIVQQILEYFHINFGLPWWEVIILGTVMCRLMLFPVYVKSRQDQIRLFNFMPELNKFQEKINQAKLSGDYFTVTQTTQEFMQFLKEKNVSFFAGFKALLCQGPVFFSMFYGLKKMAEVPVESLKTGGLFWFEDLTKSDPYCILPAILSCTLFAVIELGAETGPVSQRTQVIKWVLRFIPGMVFIFSMNFPSCVALYWTASNFIVLTQVGLLKIPWISKALNIPKIIPFDLPKSSGSKKPIIQEIKEEGLVLFRIAYYTTQRLLEGKSAQWWSMVGNFWSSVVNIRLLEGIPGIGQSMHHLSRCRKLMKRV